jgi:hypothetical protein
MHPPECVEHLQIESQVSPEATVALRVHPSTAITAVMRASHCGDG